MSSAVVRRYCHILVTLAALVLGIFHPLSAEAQKPLYDPYRWINDPLAIADLGGPDSLPMMRMFDVGTMAQWPRDTDGRIVLAADTGAGVIRHFWAVIVHQDPEPRYRLWVDDSLLIDARDSDFFMLAHGQIRPPFDSTNMGGFDCETQIPYKRSFRWTVDYCWFVRHCVWQRVDTSQSSLPSLQSSAYRGMLEEAETQYFSRNIAAGGEAARASATLSAQDTLRLPEVAGSSYIYDLRLHVPSFDTTTLRSLWLQVFWDGNPEPSIEVPVAEFFGVNRGIRALHSFGFAVDTDSRTLDCYLPMPFNLKAVIRLINRGASATRVEAAAFYSPLEWKRDYGHLCAQYHHTEATMLGILHPVLHAKGRGRYIGTNFGFANSGFSQQVFMEGDGYFSVDSNRIDRTGLSPQYSGTEDYCNSGWYFDGTTFSYPFSGNSPNWGNMYRLHYTDPYNFTHSLDIEWGHGFNNDYKETISTVAYYYKEPLQFFVSSDTVVKGNTFHISGVGYDPNSRVSITMDRRPLSQVVTSKDGTLDATIPVLNSWSSGPHSLSVEGVSDTQPLTVIDHCVVTFLQDSADQTFYEEDSIAIRGYGFAPHEHVALRVASTRTSASASIANVIADSDGVFRLFTHLPWVPSDMYRIVASGVTSGTTASDSSFSITRILNYEFEDLEVRGGSAFYAYISTSQGYWSQSAIRFCSGDWKEGTRVSFNFFVPFTDSFAVQIFGINGNRYANYRTWIDNTDCGAKDWYVDVPWGVISRDSTELRNTFLTKGSHVIEFVNEGHQDSAVEYSIGPDNMHLTPLSTNSRAATPVRKGRSSSSFALFPSPLTSDILMVDGLPAGTISVSICDAVGRELKRYPAAGSSAKLFVPELPSGVYWLRAVGRYSTEARAFVVEH